MAFTYKLFCTLILLPHWIMLCGFFSDTTFVNRNIGWRSLSATESRQSSPCQGLYNWCSRKLNMNLALYWWLDLFFFQICHIVLWLETNLFHFNTCFIFLKFNFWSPCSVDYFLLQLAYGHTAACDIESLLLILKKKKEKKLISNPHELGLDSLFYFSLYAGN